VVTVAAVTAVSEQSAELDVGDEWLIVVATTDDDGLPQTATVVVSVTTPSGVTSTPTVDEDDTDATYTARFTTAEAGRYLAVATASVDVVGVVPFTAWATDPAAASLTPDVAAVTLYLGDTSWSSAEISSALTAEAAAQRARCRIPAVYPADLAEALKRRVARNLAARAVPVATFTSFDGQATSTRVPMLDAEIVRLEAPYRRRKVG
jgi:hypothetical protein